MELGVNDYVRTKDGYICKIININEFREPSMKYGVEASYLKDIMFIGDENIFKSSPNIIDLIEVGDILTIKDMLGNTSKVEVDENFKLLSGKIVSIVTKEQFSSMEYKI